MRLFLLSILLVSAVYTLECLNYAEFLYGDKNKMGDVPKIKDMMPIESLDYKTCEEGERCTVYYYFITDGGEGKYAAFWAECWGGDNKVPAGQCGIVRNGESMNDRFKEYSYGCACATDRCTSPEEARNKWKEELKRFPGFPALPTDIPLTEKADQGNPTPSNAGGGYAGQQPYSEGSKVFSTMSALLIAVLVLGLISQ